MAMTPYSGDTSVIGKLGTTPQERGLTTQQFKDKFDEGLKNFVQWFNTAHKSEYDAHVADYTNYVDKHKTLKIDNPDAPISLVQYIANLRMDNAFFIGGRAEIPNITGLPDGIPNSYAVVVIGGNAYGTLYYATVIIVSLLFPGIMYYGQIYNDTAFTGWKRLVVEDEVMSGTGSPEGVVSAPMGTLYRRIDAGELYVKKTGTGNTGWGKVTTS